MAIGLKARLGGLSWRASSAELAAELRGGRPRVLHIGGYWRGENDIVRQAMLGLAASGARLTELCTDQRPELLDCEGRALDRGTLGPCWLRFEGLAAELVALRPHAVICHAGGLAFRPAEARWLRRRCALLGIAWSDPDVFEPATRRIAPTFDLFLSNDPGRLPAYRALGVDVEAMRFGTNPEFWRPVAARPELDTEVLVIGRAHADRVEPVRELERRFRTRVHGEAWEQHGLRPHPNVFGAELLATLASARVVIVFTRSMAGHPIFKPQILDFVAAGAIVLCEDWEGLRARFEPGREIAVFSSPAEIPAVVERLLGNPQAALAVARAGRERVLREHAWPVLWPGLLARLARAVEGRAATRPGAQSPGRLASTSMVSPGSM